MPDSVNRHWRRYRFLFVGVLLLAFALVVGYTVLVNQQQGYVKLEQRAQADLNRYLLSLQQKLDRYEDLPNLLATHSILINALLNADDVLHMRDANRYLQSTNQLVGAAEIYLMDATGETIAASNWQETNSFVGKNYSFRPYFQQAIYGEPGRYFALGSVSNKRGYYFSHPMFDVQENIVGVVVVKIELNEIESDWSDPFLDILVTDEDGVIFISTRQDWKFRTLRPLSQQDLQRISESLRYGKHELTALDIVQRKQHTEDLQLITLVDGKRINNSAFDGVKAREFLSLRRALPSAGLEVVVLASTEVVKEAMLYSAVTSAVVFLAFVLLVLFIATRRRIIRERESFKRKATAVLEANEQRIRAILESTQAGLITLDIQGGIESMNSMAEKLFGYSESSSKGQRFIDFIAPEYRGMCGQHIVKAKQAKQEAGEELFIEANGQRSDGSTFPIELIIGQMSYADDKHFVVTIHDISQRKEYEEALQRAHDQLEHRVEIRTAALTDANSKLTIEVENHKNTQNELIQTAKMAVLGQMSAGINHELNQPLTAIRTYADNAKAFIDRGKADTAISNLQQISALIERMAKIIHPLKEFSRKTSGTAEKVCLGQVRDGAMSIMYGRLHKSAARVEWPQELDSCFVLGDTVRLEQVLVNLISNALQAMETQSEPKVDISQYSEGEKLILSIRDHGPGIPNAELERVFEPFYTTKQAGQGLGLGLSISHRIVESMGGELSVANHPEGGAVFTISLPLAAA